MIKAFCIDIDNTLLDSLAGHDVAFYQALKDHGIVLTEEYKRTKMSHVSSYKLDLLAKEGIIDRIAVPWLLEEKNQIALTTCFENYSFNQEHYDIMDYLKYSMKCKIVLCSNSPRKFVDKFVKLSGFEDLISFSLSGEDVELKKPQPDIYIKAFRLLGITPQEAVIIEDSEEGKIAAIRSSCHNIIMVKNPQHLTLDFIKEKMAYFK